VAFPFAASIQLHVSALVAAANRIPRLGVTDEAAKAQRLEPAEVCFCTDSKGRAGMPDCAAPRGQDGLGMAQICEAIVRNSDMGEAED
jgi:hypothetical protein